MQSLDSKEFSTGFYQWWHLLLQDAGCQYGFRHAFITVPPWEWTFLQVYSFRYVLQSGPSFPNSLCIKLVTFFWYSFLFLTPYLRLLYTRKFFPYKIYYTVILLLFYLQCSGNILCLILFIRSSGFTINNWWLMKIYIICLPTLQYTCCIFYSHMPKVTSQAQILIDGRTML